MAWASTVNAPPKIECRALPPSRTSTTSVSRPEPRRAARRPATSLPSVVAAIRMPAGLAVSASAARMSTLGVTR
ncbi:Uncharacterised protein [Mycobacteroides abscessus subsp. abscessus]|nr:Uncharacterised protein [Mycobacteroides abscessus subsp. abscessus]